MNKKNFFLSVATISLLLLNSCKKADSATTVAPDNQNNYPATLSCDTNRHSVSFLQPGKFEQQHEQSGMPNGKDLVIINNSVAGYTPRLCLAVRTCFFCTWGVGSTDQAVLRFARKEKSDFFNTGYESYDTNSYYMGNVTLTVSTVSPRLTGTFNGTVFMKVPDSSNKHSYHYLYSDSMVITNGRFDYAN